MQMKDGFPFPDPKCTPGAINPTVTLTVLKDSSFRTGCIRDCTSSAAQKAKTYDAYGIPHPQHNTGTTQTCELDHLIPLEMEGADTVDNIWPQCGPDGVALPERYFKQKDAVENYLTAQVKSGQRSLETSQRGIAKDWTQYLDKAKSFCGSRKCAGEK